MSDNVKNKLHADGWCEFVSKRGRNHAIFRRNSGKLKKIDGNFKNGAFFILKFPKSEF
jgi:hypothetical protein